MGFLKSLGRPYLYLAAVLFLALVIFFVEKPMREKTGDRLDQPLFEEFESEAVNRIEIEHLLSGVQLEKKEGKWNVAYFSSTLKKEIDRQDKKSPNPAPVWYLADFDRVDLSLTALTDATITALVGKNKERHGFFEVNPVGMQVRLLDASGKKLAHLYIGKTGPAFTESYVRKEGEEEVYIANRYLRSSFPPEVNDWRERTLWEFPPESLEQIKIERGPKRLTLKKEGEKWEWVEPKGKTLDAAKVSHLVTKLAKVEAAGFENDPKAKTGLEQPQLSLQIISSAGVAKLFVGKEKEYGEPFAKKEGDIQVYLLREDFLKLFDQFVQPN